MARSTTNRSTKIVKTMILAAASIGLYTALFMNEANVIKYYTKGSFYAALPVATAFVFSLVHGSFASQFLDALGITAKKTTSERPAVSQKQEKETRRDNRARMSAN